MEGKAFYIKYNGLLAKVTRVMIVHKEGYKLEWPDYTLDWIYYNPELEKWESETTIGTNMLKEVGKMIQAKLT